MKFIKPLEENTSIEWWNEARRECNKIIHKYNDWVIEGKPSDKKMYLINLTEYYRQTITKDSPVCHETLDEISAELSSN